MPSKNVPRRGAHDTGREAGFLNGHSLRPVSLPSGTSLTAVGLALGQMVAKLRDIKVAELPGAIGKLTEVHDRCCRFIGSHKQPLETLNVRPTFEKLEEDWRTIQEVHQACAK